MIKVNLSPVDISEKDIQAVTQALRSGWLAHGENNTLFEKEFAEFLDIDFALSLNSCTSALDLALRVFNFPSGSEVIIPSFTWVSTGNVVVLNNLVPVFADINLTDYQINSEMISNLITEKTVAIIGVHFSGMMCDVIKIKNLCDKNNLIFIEDSAECLGTQREGFKPGQTGIGCFSFYPTKNITTCEGGMLTCKEESIYKKCKALSAHGIEKSTYDRDKNQEENFRPNWYREATLNGFNFRMPNPLAALGRSQLSRINKMIERRQKIAQQYDEVLISKNNINLPKYESCNDKSSYQMYVFRVTGSRKKISIINELRNKGIAASSHFDPPLHKQNAFSNYEIRESLKNTEIISDSIISLPMSSALRDEEVNYTVEILDKIL